MHTPDSLDHVCSIYEAYRSMVFHVLKEDSNREILHVTGFSDSILFTPNMLVKSLKAQKAWADAFMEEKKRIADRKSEVSKAQKIRDPAEREAMLTRLTELEMTSENCAFLPAPVLYPLPPSSSEQQDPSCPAGGRGGGGLGQSRADMRQQQGILYDEYNNWGDDNDNGGGGAMDRDEGFGDDSDRMVDGPGGVKIRTGIPQFKLIMRVDIQGKFNRDGKLMAFQANFGGLPQRATLELTEMMYKTSMPGRASRIRGSGSRRRRAAGCRKRSRREDENTDGDGGGNNSNSSGGSTDDEDCDEQDIRLPNDIFLKDPKIYQPYTRMKAFKPDENTMEGFKKAECDAHLLQRIMGVVRNTRNSVQKITLFNDYLRRVARQHISSVLNNDLRSNHALYTVKYLEQVKKMFRVRVFVF